MQQPKKKLNLQILFSMYFVCRSVVHDSSKSFIYRYNIHKWIFHNMSCVMRKQTFWLPTWSDTNPAVQLQKMAKGLKFWIKKVESLPYLCSENKGADQLCGYREADLRLCFRICKMLVFS